MSRILSKLTPSSAKQKGSRLDSKFNKLTNSSQSSSPSLSDLHEIAIFSFNSSKLQIMNNNLIKNFQIIRPTSSKSLYNYLLKIQKTLVIFQYLIQVGSEDFINCWKYVELSGKFESNNYDILPSLLENLESIENSNLCQEPTYIYSTSSSNSMKNNIRSTLSSVINKLSKLKNYLSDPEDLQQFRLSFQKLRFDMSRPTPRSSMDSHPRLNPSSSVDGGRNSISGNLRSNYRTASYGENTNLIDLSSNSDDFNKIDFQIMEPNVDIAGNLQNMAKRRVSVNHHPAPITPRNTSQRSFSASKSLDLNRLINSPSGSASGNNGNYKELQKNDFKNFSNKLLKFRGNSNNDNNSKVSSPLSRTSYSASDNNENGKVLTPLIEVNEALV